MFFTLKEFFYFGQKNSSKSFDLVGIGGGEYRSVQKKRRVEGGEWRVEGGSGGWRVEGEEVWSVQESGSEKI